MGISKRLRPALIGRITSSVASTASYGITRVLSFTDSFNEQTSLLLDAALTHEPASPSSAQAQAAPAQTTTANATFDIEAAATPAATSSIGGEEPPPPPTALQDDAESKRVAKLVQTVCLFVASASLVLFVNPPRHRAGLRGGGGGAMRTANLAFVCFGLFTSLGLSMFSIIARPGEPAVAGVQKWGMVAAVASVLAASALRMVVMLPAASLEFAWIVAVVLAGVVVVYLSSLAWKLGGGRQAEAPSGGSDHGADGVAAADPATLAV